MNVSHPAVKCILYLTWIVQNVLGVVQEYVDQGERIPKYHRRHGARLVDPAGRSSLWRNNIKGAMVNTDDDQQNCGGVQVHWYLNKGQCGLCGDPWNGPRNHEAGGKYFRGTISRTYTKNSTIIVSVNITENLLGWFEFRIAAYTDTVPNVTQLDLDKHVLRISEVGVTQYRIRKYGIHIVPLQLPADLMCDHCVLQWRYHTGMLWGCDDTSSCCYGCGPIQEEFYGCADVSIVNEPPPSTFPPLNQDSYELSASSYLDWWCLSQCNGMECHSPSCGAVRSKRVLRKRSLGLIQCRATGRYYGNLGLDEWCKENCQRSFCPPEYCMCVIAQPSTTTTEKPTTTTKPPTTEAPLKNDTPMTIRLLAVAGCRYGLLRGDRSAMRRFCHGYVTASLNFVGTLESRLKQLSDEFCAYCGSDVNCVNLFCAETYTLVYVAKAQRCQLCYHRQDFTCLLDPACQAYYSLKNDSLVSASAEMSVGSVQDTVAEKSSSKRDKRSSGACIAIGGYWGMASVTSWCRSTCPTGYCPPNVCYCPEESPKTKPSITTSTPTTTTITTPTTTTTTTTTTPTTTTTTTTTTPTTTTPTTTTPTTTTTTTPTTTTTSTSASTTLTTDVPTTKDEITLYSLNTLSYILCRTCTKKKEATGSYSFQKCTREFCPHYTSDLAKPANSTGLVPSIAISLQCVLAEYTSNISHMLTFCQEKLIIQEYIYYGQCYGCVILGGTTLCDLYCLY